MRVQGGLGRYAAGEGDLLLIPNAGPSFTNIGDPVKRPVLYAHGRGGNAYHALYPNSSNPNQGRFARAMTDGGYCVVSGDVGGATTWGNPTMRTRVGDMRTWAQGTLGGRSGKVHLFGVSMGGLGMLNVAAALGAASVASLTLVLPVVDPEYVRANNKGASAAEINAAFGGVYLDATERATSNPLYMASPAGGSKYAGINILLLHAENDDYTPMSKYTEFASYVPSAALVSLGPGTIHDDVAMGQAAMGLIPAFLDANN